MTVGLLIYPMIVAAVSAADPIVNTDLLKQVKNGGIGSEAARASNPRVLGPLKAPQGHKGLAVSRPVSGPRNTVSHPLGCPATFPRKDGVYIWCDPDGVWSISWWAREYFALNALLTAKKPITVKRSVKAKINFLKTGAEQLEILSTPKARGGIVQFTSADDSVQFEILVDGVADPNRVYVGSRLDNPKQFPLELKTRTKFFTNGIPEAKAIFCEQKSAESIDENMRPPGSPSRSTAPTGRQSHGSGHGGGKVIGGNIEGTANK